GAAGVVAVADAPAPQVGAGAVQHGAAEVRRRPVEAAQPAPAQVQLDEGVLGELLGDAHVADDEHRQPHELVVVLPVERLERVGARAGARPHPRRRAGARPRAGREAHHPHHVGQTPEGRRALTRRWRQRTVARCSPGVHVRARFGMPTLPSLRASGGDGADPGRDEVASLTFESVTKWFVDVVADGFAAVVVGFALDLATLDGVCLVWLGPPGCWKTMVYRLTAGLEEITEGRLCIGDRVVNDVDPARWDVSMVFQSYALYPHMT